MSLRIRRGTNNERSGITFDMAEVVWTTDSQQLWVGDGVTQGGINILANSAGTGLLWNATTKKLEFAGASYTTDDIPAGTSNSRQYFSVEAAQDAAAALLTNGVHSNITFTYTTTQDNANRIDASVTLDGVGISALVADTDPNLGGDLVLNTHDITGTGNIDITGTVTATSFTGNIVSSQITSADPISIGSLTQPTQLNVYSNTEPLAIFNGITDNVTPPNIFIHVARSSGIAPETVLAGDEIGGINTKIFDGTSLKSVSNILTAITNDAVLSDANPKAEVYIAVAAGGSDFGVFEFRGNGTFVVPGDGSAVNPSIVFGTDASQDTGFFHPQDGVLCISTDATERVRVDNGGVRVNGFMKVKDYGGGSLPTPPEAGMIVLQNGIFQGYNGSAWVTLG